MGNYGLSRSWRVDDLSQVCCREGAVARRQIGANRNGYHHAYLNAKTKASSYYYAIDTLTLSQMFSLNVIAIAIVNDIADAFAIATATAYTNGANPPPSLDPTVSCATSSAHTARWRSPITGPPRAGQRDCGNRTRPLLLWREGERQIAAPRGNGGLPSVLFRGNRMRREKGA